MNRLRKTFFTASLALFLSAPFSATADDAVPDAAVPTMHTMHDLMREVRQNQDPEKCKTQAQIAAEPASIANGPCKNKRMMSEEPCRLGDGRPGCKSGNCMHDGDKPCMQSGPKGCRMQGGDDDARLTELEKRMDMMQLMLEMILRSVGGNR